MFARGLVACSRGVAACEAQSFARCSRLSKRRYSSNAPDIPVPSADSSSPIAALAGLNSELDKLTPRFDIDANQIQIIRTPADFYETLKVG